jgi:hypothetical protein
MKQLCRFKILQTEAMKRFYHSNVLRILCEFLSSPRWMHSGKKDRERARRKAEKEEYGIVVYCYLVCTAPPPPPHHLFPILPAQLHLPAAMEGLEVLWGAPPITHTPFQQFEATALDLEESL